MNFLVGCPFSSRSWIFDLWMDHILAASNNAGLNPSFLFVVGSGNQSDIETVSSIDNSFVRVVSEDPRDDVRKWSGDRYSHMVYLRNELLNLVREKKPDLFLSLDSDILLAPDAIESSLDALDQFPAASAVGMKCYMSPTTKTHPSMGIWMDGDMQRFYRRDADDICTVDIIMAAKLMRPFAYGIDYQWHKNGEDLGWSKAIKQAGGSLIWDGRVANKHVMSPAFLDVVDARCGF